MSSSSKAKRASFMDRYKARMSFDQGEQAADPVAELQYDKEDIVTEQEVKQEVLQESELDNFEKDDEAHEEPIAQDDDANDATEDDKGEEVVIAEIVVPEEEIAEEICTEEHVEEVAATMKDIEDIPPFENEEVEKEEEVADEPSEQDQEDATEDELIPANEVQEETVHVEDQQDLDTADQESDNENRTPTPPQQKKQFPPVSDEAPRRESVTAENGEKEIKRGTVKGLINLFSNPDELAKQAHPAVNKSYKNEGTSRIDEAKKAFL